MVAVAVLSSNFKFQQHENNSNPISKHSLFSYPYLFNFILTSQIVWRWTDMPTRVQYTNRILLSIQICPAWCGRVM